MATGRAILIALLTVFPGLELSATPMPLPVVKRHPVLVLQNPQLPRHTEHVEVSRVLIDARAVDDFGQPLRGLGPDDFKVKVDGKPARVESAFWVGSDEGAADTSSTPPVAVAPVPPQARGRLIVFLFQKDLEPSRIVGLMRMLLETQRFLDSLGPDDRVAVLSFDYKLKIWLDFTRDRERVRAAMESILKKNPAPVVPSVSPSLMTTLDVVKANRAYSMEQALALLGESLEPLTGSKSVVLIGHGFGRLSGNSLIFEQAYGEARRALQAARASVFCLDVTDADSHTLEAGLQMTAEDTGGFFARTNLFSGLAMKRLAGALAGHYVLFVEATSESRKGWHDIDVELVRHHGRVMAKRHYLTPS
jgi:VWFA-related protein